MKQLMTLLLLALTNPAYAKLSAESYNKVAPHSMRQVEALQTDERIELKAGETVEAAGTRMCVQKLGKPEFLPILIPLAREQAFANVLANAMAAAFDLPENASNQRCFQSMNWFDSFLQHYFMPNYTQELLVGNAFPYVTMPDGRRAQLNCAAALYDLLPGIFDLSQGGMIDTIQSLVDRPERLKRMIETAFNGRMRHTNHPDARVVEIGPSSENSSCLIVKLDSKKYEYGRAFRVCTDSRASGCLDYFGGKFN